MKRYIIGVDGGGTKTLGVLFDLHGNAKKQVKSGFANFNVDTKKTIEHVKEILQLLTEGINLDQIEMIQIGIAGYTNFEGKELLLKELRENYLTEVSIVTDAEIALYSVKKDSDSDAIMVLGGTGSVIMLEHHGEIHFIGGFGHLLGDEGSGYHLSITALKHIIEQYEKNEGITDLSKSILINIGASAYSDIKKFVYNNPKSIVAELSPFIAKHAEDGNEEAIKLFKQEGILLAEQALRAYHTLN